jgi:RNA polymerase sigma-70 factor (ECF subfamily)
MSSYQKGDYSAFQELYRRYSGKVYGYVLRRVKNEEKAAEIFQSIFLKLHQSRTSYRAALPFAPWLFTVCNSIVLDSFKSKHVRMEHLLNPIEDHPDIASPKPEEKRDLSPVMESLPSAQRNLLKLRFVDELTFSEISARLKINETSVRQRLSRIIRSLRKAELP